MPRAVWTGTLSFGLVSIPVALYPATSPKDVRFHLFDREGRRVRYRRFAEEPAPGTGAPHPDGGLVDVEAGGGADVPMPGVAGSRGDASPAAEAEAERSDRELAYDELVRGYEVEPGRFAMLEQEEIEQVRPSRSSTIELEDFVELEAIDPVFFEKSYYLAPRRDAAKPYRLLQIALERTDRVGIGRFVLRTKPHLVAVRPTEEALVLETLYFGDEVRSPAEVLSPPDGEVSERELRLAEQLVEMLATSWEPDRYADEYRDELLRLIAEKAPVETAVAETETAVMPSRVEELMEALKRSVEEAKEARQDGRRSQRHTG